MSGNIRKVQLEYGLRGDKVIFVSELTDLERGKACNCICPVCRKQLVAKLGSHNQWHFAHDGAECNLVAAQQTALHMLAKEIIESSKKLRFPGIYIKKDDYCNDIEDIRVQAKIPPSIGYRKSSVVNCDKLPFFLNIPITGEMVFPCDRRIWQSALFDKFVFNRNSEGENKPTVHIKKVQKWIEEYNKQFPIDWGLTYKTEVLVSREEKKTVSLLYDVVYTFFKYLVYLGFLEPFFFQEAVLRQSHSLEPPNREHAENLYDAINKVDWYDPAVDDRIEQFLTPTKSVRNTYLPRNRMLLNEMENQETISPKTNREDSKKEIEKDRATGLADVQDKDFDGSEPVYDRSNWRWLKCTNCEKLFREDQMASYGGRGSINKGICRKCSNDQEKG